MPLQRFDLFEWLSDYDLEFQHQVHRALRIVLPVIGFVLAFSVALNAR